MSNWGIEMTRADGTTVVVREGFDTARQAMSEMNQMRSEGAFTDGRDVGGDLYAPNAVRVVRA
jgi:hypothetical protein